MKVLFVHSSEKIKEDEKGNLYVDGAYSKDVFERYLSIGNELTVIFRKEKKIYKEEYAKKNFEKFPAGKIKFVEYMNRHSSIKNFFSLNIIKKNKQIIEKQVLENDKIIIRLPCNAGNETAKYARKYKKEYMVEVVGCIWDALWNYNIKGKVLALWNFIKMRESVKKAKYAIYVTDKFLQKRYPNKFNNISCSDVSIQKLDDSILNNRLEKINEIRNDKNIKLATTAAVDVKYKGQKYVLKAMKILKEKGYNIKYYIIGGGNVSYLSEIVRKQNLQGEVVFTGAIPHDKVFEYLDDIDIYVQPSNVEGLPRAVIEAMSRACPVIVSNAGGNTELVKNNQFVFKKGNYKALIKCIENLTRTKMLEQAKENFEMVKKYEEKVLKDKRQKFYELFKK